MFSGVSAFEQTFDDDDDDWLGRLQRGCQKLTAPRVRLTQRPENEKRQKDKNTKIQKYKNTNTKYRLQKNVKNHPSYKK